MKEKEGIKELFYEFYNDTSLTTSITNKSLRRRLERFRNQMSVDFYNIDSQDDIKDFGAKYLKYIQGWGKTQTEHFGQLFYSQEHEIYYSIVDKVMSKQELSTEELEHANKAFCGEIWQTQNDTAGGWVLHRKFYFANYGLVRALYDFVLILSREGGIPNVHRCEAPDCNKLFLSTKGGSQQKYCSRTCKMRTYRRRRRGGK